MKKHIAIVAALAAAFLSGTLVHGTRQADAMTTSTGTLVGHVSVIPGVSATWCKIELVGSPITTTCDANGNFTIYNTIAASWEMKVSIPGNTFGIEPRVVRVGIPGDYETGSAGDVVLGRPGTIMGRISIPATVDTSASGQILAAIPDQGIYAPVGMDGDYLLTGVAPGNHAVQFVYPTSVHFAVNPNIASTTVTSGGLTNLNPVQFTPVVHPPLTRAP